MGEKFKASCPVCGRNLFRGATMSFVEGNCAKCGAFLKITYLENGVTVIVEEYQNKK